MLELRAEPSDGAASRALWDEYMALVASRLPGFRPTEEIFATPEAFTGPGTAWLVGYDDGRAVCCGGLRPLAGNGVGEIKRMFVSRAARRRGHGRTLLAELERRAGESGFTVVRLFTTEVLVEARALYASAGYVVVGTVARRRAHRPVAREGPLQCPFHRLGRVAQWESARFTRERSQVRNPPRPSSDGPVSGPTNSRALCALGCDLRYW